MSLDLIKQMYRLGVVELGKLESALIHGDYLKMALAGLPGLIVIIRPIGAYVKQYQYTI
jgi:hypothetical protein